MAAPDEALVFRSGGVLIANPSSLTPPDYGTGKKFGVCHEIRLTPIVRQFNVTAEEYGSEVTEAVHMGRDWIVTFLLRGWDNDALPLAGNFNTSTGSSSSNIVLNEPGGLLPGSLLSGKAVKLLFAPYNTDHKGFILYRALPNMQGGTKLNFSIKRDLSYLVTYRGLRDGSGRVIKVGQVADLAV